MAILSLKNLGGGPKQPVGRVIIFDKKHGDFSFSNFTSYIRVKDNTILDFVFLHRFLYFAYVSGATEQMQSHSTGIRNLKFDEYKKIEISYPPLPEQKRIVAILDEAFAAIDQAKANTQKNLQNAKDLFESYLQNVFAEKGEDWEEKRLADITEVKDGTHDSPKYIKDGIPFVTQKNIRESGLTLEDTNFITREDHDKFYKRSNVAYGDILISMIGANRGMSCIVDDKRVFSIKNVGLIKKCESINQGYLLHFLKSPIAKEYVAESSNGGAQEFVGLTALRNFPILVAPKKIQSTIVSKLNELSIETKKLESIYKQKLNDLEELRKSILQKAFAGELTL